MKSLLIIFLLVLSYDSFSQPAPPPSHNPAPIPGLVYLAAGGAALAFRQMQRKKSDDN